MDIKIEDIWDCNLTFRDYQGIVNPLAIYPNVGNNISYPTLGLCGEAGEVAEKVKKILRDKDGIYTVRDIDEVSKELGDCLWYLQQVASEFGLTLEGIAKNNILKLQDRKNRNVLRGSGDNR